METTDLSPSVYQLRVVVQGISPLICRRLLIRSDMSLVALHDVPQIVFAWNDVHLHGFRIHGKAYGGACLGGPSFDTDPRHVPLAALHLHVGSVSALSTFIENNQASFPIMASVTGKTNGSARALWSQRSIR